MQSLSRCHPSSTFISFLFICLLQSYPTPTSFALLLSSQASSWCCLGIRYGQQWEHKTASFLCSWCLVLKTVNQNMASESYSRLTVNPKIQVVQCKCFLEGGALLLFLKSLRNTDMAVELRVQQNPMQTKPRLVSLSDFVTLLQQTQLCSIGTSLRAWLHSTFHIWSMSWKHLKSPYGTFITDVFVEQLLKVYLMPRPQHVLRS